MVARPLYSVQDYLAIERYSEERHEYIDGYIYEMAGESGARADICANLTRIVSMQLLGSPCRVRSKDTKVRSGPDIRRDPSFKGMYSYPDVVVICGEPLYMDERHDIVLNPAVIIEVLSESTEDFDRGEKFQRYQLWNPTLTDYILASQVAPTVEHYGRQADGSWSYQIYHGLEQSFEIRSINCALPLTDLYDRIVFPDQASEKPADA